MKGQLSLEVVLIGLLAVASAGVFFTSMLRIIANTQSQASLAVIYPEEPPQIVSLRCFLDYGYATIQTSRIQGAVRYRVKYTNGTLLKDSSTDVNITDNGKIYFGALMDRGGIYSVEFYIPKWSVSETCVPRVHDDAIFYLPLDEGLGTSVEDYAGSNDGTLYGHNDGNVSGATWTTGHSGGALKFDGVDDYVAVSESSSLDITDNITLDLWVRVDGDSQNKFPEPDAQFETGSFSSGFWVYEQANSSADIVDWESYGGTYSAHFHRDGYCPYPGKCYPEANESYRCSWNETHCICPVKNYTEGQDFEWGDSNTVMWGGIRFGSGNESSSAESRLGLEEEHFYIMSYWFKKNITSTTTNIFACANMGYCSMGMGWPTLQIVNIPSGVYGSWTYLEEPVFVPASMFDSCDGSTCLREFVLAQHHYITVPEGEDLFIDDVRLVESSALLRAGAYGISVDSDTVYGIINDQVVSANLSQGWNHVSLTYNKSKISIFVNGSLAGSGDYSSSINVSAQPLLFGNFVNGTLDEVRIYGRALSGVEIQQLHQGADIGEGIIGYWSFDEGSGATVRDTHMWTAGKRGAAARFDGVDDYIELPVSEEFNITNPFTVSALMKIFPASAHSAPLIKGSTNPRYVNYLWYYDPFNEYVRFFIGTCNSTYPPHVDLLDSPEFDQWYYLSSVFNGTHILGYLNGNSTSIAEIYFTPCLSAEPLLIGHTWSSHFGGVVDELRIYDRALSSSEIEAMYLAYFS